MAFTPISNTVPQYSALASGTSASGYYLKFYADGTTTPISMATDATGGTLLAKCELDSLGYPTTDGTVVFIPHIDQAYKLALYTNATDADNNTLASAVWVVDDLSTGDESLRTDLLGSNGTSLVTHTQGSDDFFLDKYLQARFVRSIEDKGASTAGAAAANTTAIQAALDEGGYIVIPSGTYNFTPPLSMDVDGTQLIGLDRTGSILNTDTTAANGIELGLNTGVSRCRLENFILDGDANNGHGVLLGSTTAGRFAISTTLRNLSIRNFSKVGFAGLDMRRCWWLDVEKCEFESNYNNLQIRAGSTTTTINIKDNTTIRNAVSNGLYMDGLPAVADVVTIESGTSFEYNLMGAIKSTCDKVIFNLENVYFEQNNGSGGAGVIDIFADASTLVNASTLNMHRCVTDAPLGGATGLVLEGVRESMIEDCYGWLAAAPTTTADCDIHFRNMNGQSSADFLATARTLLGAIKVEEREPSTGRWHTYSSYGNTFEGHIGATQPSAPAVAVGVGAGTSATAVMKSGSTDTAGQIQVTRGASGWSAGTLATITFSKGYNNAPTVTLTPASTGSAIQQSTLGVSATSSTTAFTVDLATADSNSGLIYWNYQVIE